MYYILWWDAFGLPAEQYALDTGNDPREFTHRLSKTNSKDLVMIGIEK